MRIKAQSISLLPKSLQLLKDISTLPIYSNFIPSPIQVSFNYKYIERSAFVDGNFFNSKRKEEKKVFFNKNEQQFRAQSRPSSFRFSHKK